MEIIFSQYLESKQVFSQIQSVHCGNDGLLKSALKGSTNIQLVSVMLLHPSFYRKEPKLFFITNVEILVM